MNNLLNSVLIDLNLPDETQLIEVCPQGKQCAIESITLRSFSGQALATKVSFGWDDSAADVIREVDLSEINPDSNTFVPITTGSVEGEKIELGNAGQVFGARVVQVEGSPLTCVADVRGFLF